MMKGVGQPSNLELQALSVLWEAGPSTVREVWAAMPDGKERAYTTVLTVLQNLEKKGLVAKSDDGTAHRYAPTTSRSQTLGPILKGLLRNVFGGRASSVMQQLLEDPELSDEDLSEIRRLIDVRRREGKAGKKEEEKEGGR